MLMSIYDPRINYNITTNTRKLKTLQISGLTFLSCPIDSHAYVIVNNIAGNGQTIGQPN